MPNTMRIMNRLVVCWKQKMIKRQRKKNENVGQYLLISPKSLSGEGDNVGILNLKLASARLSEQGVPSSTLQGDSSSTSVSTFL